MRTTLTIDDDNVIRLERLRKERDVSLKSLVNDAIRRGLDTLIAPPETHKSLKVRVFDCGKPLFKSPEELKELVNELQLEDDLRNLGMK